LRTFAIRNPWPSAVLGARVSLSYLSRIWGPPQCANGGIIITNNKEAWLRVFSKIKYKRDRQGRIAIMDKVIFKKEYGFSPDRFDAALHTFFKDSPTKELTPSPAAVQAQEAAEFIQRANESAASDTYTSM
jgi:hypothetical protein